MPTNQGGTGLTSFTANGVVYANTASSLLTSNSLTFDGTKLEIAGGVSAQQVTGRYFGFGTAGFSFDSTTVNDYGITYTQPVGNFNTVLSGFSNIKFCVSQSLKAVLDATGNLTLNVGNLVQGTAAKGINFTANTPAAGMTSQLLNWYEEGTWTPADASGASLTFTSVTARFVRIGKQVSVTATLTYPTTASASQAKISGLPYAPAVSGQLLLASPGNSSAAPGQGLIDAASTTILFVSQNNLVKPNSALSTLILYFNGSYIV
jgi:hypothetical protein